MSRSVSLRTLSVTLSSLAAAAGALLAGPAGARAAAFDTSEANFDYTYAATPIALTGQVLDEAGAAVPSAQITTIGWGGAAGNSGLIATTDAAGAFSIPSLSRRSILIKVTHPGYYTEIVPVDLHRPLSQSTQALGEVVLTLKKPGRGRFLFAGDTMIGRRFVDADQNGVEGEAGDLIRPGSRADDAKALMNFMRDALSAADYTVVNLESTITASPTTPHPYKSFVFYSYPEVLAALPYAGIDAVSLGNNHTYDYMEAGISDTLAAVPNAGLDWFGAGMSDTAAEGTTIYRTIGQGVDVAFQGFDQLVNADSTLPEYTLTAHDAPGQKGGALEMSTSNTTNFMADETPDRLAIPILHGGTEYIDYQNATMRARFVQLVNQGADLLVTSHPHVVQGVALYDPGDGPRFVLTSLGNLIFDQDVFETFQSFFAIVDVDQYAPGVHEVHRVQLVPFFIENYVPKLVSGPKVACAGRHVAHLSTTLPPSPTVGGAPDGLVGATVFTAGSRIAALEDPARYLTTDATQSITAPITALGTGPIELTRSDPTDSLANVTSSAAVKCEVGREIGLYGGFEDEDVDDLYHEGSMWSQGTTRYVENSVVRSGNGAAVLIRTKSSTTAASLSMGNRVRFDPANKLTLLGYVKGSNAGPFKIEVSWYTSGGTSISSSFVYTRTAGTYDWERFSIDLTPPAGAESIRPYYRAYAPSTGEANTFLDDVAIIEWEQSTANAQGGFPLATPNNWSFLRCSTTSAGLASVGLTLTHRTYELAATLP